MTLRQLEIFTAAAQQGSFTRAAGELLLSEAAVSQQIKLLETIVGSKLFERVPRRPIRLTDAGWLLLQTCDGVFQQVDATLQQLEALGGQNTQRVSLGVGTCFGSYVLPPILAAFRQEHAAIPIIVDSERMGRWPERVRRREVDLAVATDYEEDDIDLTCIPFAQKDLVWIGRAGHRLANGAPAPVEALKDEPLIVGPPATSTRRALDLLIESRGIVLHPTYELASSEACITAVASGMGIALVAHPTVLPRELAHSVAVLNVEGFPVRLNWSLIWRTRELSPAAAVFRDYLLGYGHQVVTQVPVVAARTEGGRELQLA